MKIGILIIALLYVAGCSAPNDQPGDVQGPPARLDIRPLSIVEGSSEFPDSLADPYPNPYNHQLGDTTIFIHFTLRDSADVKGIIQNPIGDSVAFFRDAILAPGSYEIRWTPLNALNVPLREGLYFITLRADPERRNYIDSKLLYIENND